MTTTYTFAGGPIRQVEGEPSSSGDAVFATAKAMLERLNKRNPPRPAKPMPKPTANATSQPAGFAAGALIAEAKRRAQGWEMSRKAQALPPLGDVA